MTAASKGPVVVLVGPPGAGKSTVGKLVATRLGVDFRDTDDDIVRMAGKSIPEIFYDDGEDQFRALEGKAVTVALAEHAGVLALGGGAVLAESNRRLLRDVPVVYLAVGFSAAVRRVGLSHDRPVLALNPRAQLHSLLEQRRPLYEEVATATVTTDGRTPGEVADAVLEAVR